MTVIQSLRRRWKLRRICGKLNIKAYPWQRDFALGLTDRLEYPPGPQTGKTTAVMLRLLMLEHASVCEVDDIMRQDPDYVGAPLARLLFYHSEYLRASRLCGREPFVRLTTLPLRAAVLRAFTASKPVQHSSQNIQEHPEV